MMHALKALRTPRALVCMCVCPVFDQTSCCLDERIYRTKDGEISGEADRFLIEDVRDAVADLVELIKTYRSKNRMSQVIMSTLFKRRQEEADAVIDRAVSHLHVSVAVFKLVFAISEPVQFFVYRGFASATTINVRTPPDTGDTDTNPTWILSIRVAVTLLVC